MGGSGSVSFNAQYGARKVQSPHNRSHAYSGAEPGSTQAPLPPLSEDLRASIQTLVQKVNATLSGNAMASSGDERGMVASTIGPNASGLDTPGAQEGFIRALQAVQELRDRNESLREANAELAEELMAQDGLLSSCGSIYGALPQWPPSAQQSACATPGRTTTTVQMPCAQEHAVQDQQERVQTHSAVPSVRLAVANPHDGLVPANQIDMAQTGSSSMRAPSQSRHVGEQITSIGSPNAPLTGSVNISVRSAPLQPDINRTHVSSNHAGLSSFSSRPGPTRVPVHKPLIKSLYPTLQAGDA